MPIQLTNAVLMGSGGATVVPGVKFRDKTATYERRVFRWQGPASYVTGGEVVNTLSTFGLGSVPVVHSNPALNAAQTIVHPRWNRTTQKMQWFVAAGTEVPNGTDLSGYAFYGEALGW